MSVARKTFRKQITTEELKAEINPQNLKLAERFLKNFSTRSSEKSVKVYKSNFNIFFCWNLIYNDNKFFTDIKKIDLMDFFDYCINELKWSSNRFTNMRSSLSSLSTFIENILDEDYPNFRNLVEKISKPPKETVREKTILTDKQINKLMNHLTQNKLTQQACFLALAFGSGARISELFRFDIDIIDIENTVIDGVFIETLDKIQIKGHGRNGKKELRYIVKDIFVPRYLEWLKEREVIMKENGKDHNFLFIKIDGDPCTEDIARRWMSSWGKFLTQDIETNPSGNEIHFYAHCIRHLTVSWLSRCGIESELIVEIFKWTSPEMFMIYNDNTMKDKQWKNLDKIKFDF